MHHAECAAKLTIPRDKRMHRRTAIHPLETIVGAFNDVQQPAWRTAAGIVFSREDFTIGTHEQSKGIPESAGDAAHLFAIGAAAKHTTFAATAHL